jgi:hypothetical protein
MLYFGMAGALLTLLADILLTGISTLPGSGMLDRYVQIAAGISYTRICFSALIGWLAIPLTLPGFLALGKMVKEKPVKPARLYSSSVLICFGILAGGMHIICCALLAAIKIQVEAGNSEMYQTVIGQTGWLVFPAALLFYGAYLAVCISMIFLVAKGKTLLPKWMWICNPLTFKILINLAAKAGSSAFCNALASSNMSLGSLLLFIFWLIAYRKAQKKKTAAKS